LNSVGHRGVVARVCASDVRVLSTPFESSNRQFPSIERDRSWRESTGDTDRVGTPLWVNSHDLGLGSDVRGGKVVQFLRLRLDPPKRLETLEQEVVLRQSSGEIDTVVGSSLRDPGDSLDLLDLLVVGRRRSVQVGNDLCTQIGIDNERLEDVLGHNIGEARSIVLDVVVANKDVVNSKGQVGSRDSSDPPVGLGS
jgi:hypothetical protein